MPCKPVQTYQSSDSKGPPNPKPDKLNPHLDTTSVQLLNIKDKEKIQKDIRKRWNTYQGMTDHPKTRKD